MNTKLKVGDSELAIEYQLAPQMVVFSHGFAVQRDNRGLFTDIVTALPAGFGYILFDYYKVDDTLKTVAAVHFTEQVEKLKAVLDWSHAQAEVQNVHLIGHSLGGIVIAELAPENIGQIILLAPPASPPGDHTRRRHYTGIAGASERSGVWHLPRRDGTTTIVSDTQFNELEQLDCEGELVKLALFRPYHLIIAEADEVLQDTDYTELMVLPSVHFTAIPDADHNFKGAARGQLLTAITGLLAETTPKAVH